MTKEKTGLIVLAMALGLLMSSLDNTITSAALSHIIKDIGGFEQVSWVFTAYMLASTSMMLVFGKMSDLFGRKLFYLIGISIFLIGSALCGMAQDITQLIVFRAIQGIGAGALLPISFTIIYTVFADPKQAAKMAGVFAGIFGLSSVAGPQIGTLLSEAWGWRWCFYVNVPIGIVSFLVLLVALKESRSERKPKIDYLGTAFLIICTISLMLALEWGGKDYAWTSWQILSLFAVSLIVGLLFIFVELRAEEPILPLVLFKNRMVVGLCLACLCQGAIMFSAIAYLPIFSTAVLGQENSNALLTPMMVSLISGAVLFGFLQSRFAYRTLIAFTMTAGVVVSYLLSTVSHDASKWYMIGLMVLLGLGAIGPLMSMSQTAMAASVERKYIGISSSIVGFWRSIGGVLGASIMATIVNNNLKTLLSDGAAEHHISQDQIATLANPEQLVRGADNVPQEIVAFVRDSLGTAINHGFMLSMVFAVLGIVAAFVAGPGRHDIPAAQSAAKQAS
ncbi:drug resistance transporter, EmrB/QacA subfamily [Paenibacillus algorifonticola]|uniref:Drug resistance transporter, EmrB/QacA subfamily n=1 Tax=Paenibacillus algorifonticola TaxID=684063 RepID=A0A1I2BYW7_9BACL|nr:DHA2 family efflux MFS transporter permease subunit [Paenibacillus algorifonticola]SFE61165.1 drug resistance transporter, EmrB/QacA subfamily [Paenibacillus algorifonticola]